MIFFCIFLISSNLVEYKVLPGLYHGNEDMDTPDKNKGFAEFREVD